MRSGGAIEKRKEAMTSMQRDATLPHMPLALPFSYMELGARNLFTDDFNLHWKLT